LKWFESFFSQNGACKKIHIRKLGKRKGENQRNGKGPRETIQPIHPEKPYFDKLSSPREIKH
jgi:hypothetical protein